MAFNLILNIIFVLSVLGIVVLLVRRLPQANAFMHKNSAAQEDPLASLEKTLKSKGLPFLVFSKTKNFFKVLLHKITQFLLEAKGLKPVPKIRYGFKKVLGQGQTFEDNAFVAKNETFYIAQIKANPKDLVNYDLLGQFYMKEHKYTDAISLYDYLTKHDPTKVSYWARYGLANLQNKDYKQAAAAYQKAIDLDNSVPGRFFNLALSYNGAGEYAKAIAAVQKALHLDPDNKKYQDYKFELESKK